jgi:hypothetical protein
MYHKESNMKTLEVDAVSSVKVKVLRQVFVVTL